jgi:hypothetical protein
MLYAVNRAYGGFRLSEELAKELGVRIYASYEFVRTDPRTFASIRAGKERDLAIIDIPDEATDWELNEYDGLEDVIAVVDGKLYHVPNIHED